MLGNSCGKMQCMCAADYVVFDLETTGISPVSDRIIELAAVKVIGGQITDEMSTFVDPHMHISAGASAVNGITDDMVKGAPDISEVLPEFLRFIGDLPLAGHNIHSFDMKFIYRECENCFGMVPGNDYIDTLKIARAVLPQLPHHKLTDLAQYYQIDTRGAHRALNDVRMNQMVYERLRSETVSAGGAKQRSCPRCGQLLQKRNGRYGEFWGCMGYPSCRYTENC